MRSTGTVIIIIKRDAGNSKSRSAPYYGALLSGKFNRIMPTSVPIYPESFVTISILCLKKVVHQTHGDNFVNS